MHHFTAKDSEIKPSPLCLGNISKDFTADKIKKTGLKGHSYKLSVDCDAINVSDIKDIHHKYLIKKYSVA